MVLVVDIDEATISGRTVADFGLAYGALQVMLAWVNAGGVIYAVTTRSEMMAEAMDWVAGVLPDDLDPRGVSVICCDEFGARGDCIYHELQKISTAVGGFMIMSADESVCRTLDQLGYTTLQVR